jgi:hypothetical protein
MDTPLDIEKKLPAHVPNRAGNEQPISDYALEQDRLLCRKSFLAQVWVPVATSTAHLTCC